MGLGHSEEGDANSSNLEALFYTLPSTQALDTMSSGPDIDQTSGTL